jgi:hypothetical protein
MLICVDRKRRRNVAVLASSVLFPDPDTIGSVDPALDGGGLRASPDASKNPIEV